MRRRTWLTLVSFGLVVNMFPYTAKATGLPLLSQSPEQILESAGNAMEAAGSFHYLLTSKLTGVPAAALSTDCAMNRGVQTQSFLGVSDTIRVIGQSLFLYANRSAYVEDLGVKNPKFADEWVSIPRSNKSYLSIEIDILTPSVVNQIVRATRLKNLGESKVDGRSVVAIQGAVSTSPAETAGTQTLYVSTTKPYLPVQEIQTSILQGRTITNTTVFSKWGEELKVSAPARFVRVSKKANV